MATTSKPGKVVAPKVLRAAAARAVASNAASGRAVASKATTVSTNAKPVAGSGGKPMTGNGYRDLIASYIHHNYASQGLVVYVEISLGKTVIGKDRCIDVFVVRPSDRKAIAIECKYQDSLGTVDEKIPYALQDLEALWVPGCLVYAGKGWSKGVLHSLEASRLACSCMPDAATLGRSKQTRELDHILAATFGFWDLVLPASKKLKPRTNPTS
jgi:hypothetical protein